MRQVHVSHRYTFSRRTSALTGTMSTSPRHTAFPTSRAFSVQSFGSISAVSHLAKTGINLRDSQAPKRFSGMPPLYDASRTWCKQREAITPCWPLPRDSFGPAQHPEVTPWAEQCGHVSPSIIMRTRAIIYICPSSLHPRRPPAISRMCTVLRPPQGWHAARSQRLSSPNRSGRLHTLPSATPAARLVLARLPLPRVALGVDVARSPPPQLRLPVPRQAAHVESRPSARNARDQAAPPPRHDDDRAVTDLGANVRPRLCEQCARAAASAKVSQPARPTRLPLPASRATVGGSRSQGVGRRSD